MGRKRFGLLATTLVALNLFLWLAPPGLALRQSLINQLFGPRLVRAEVIDSTGGGTTTDLRIDRGVVTVQTATDITLTEVDTHVQEIPLAPTTQLPRRSLLGWRVLVIWPANGAAVSVVPEVRPQGSGTGGRSRRARRVLSFDSVTISANGGVLLLVEDDDSIGRLVKQYLEQQDGWRVLWLRSGEEALAELPRHPVRMVILDLGLPGLDGFDVCRRIRAGSKVPIVMLTARDEEPDRVAGLELGADDYVSKPFSPRELSARIKAILRRADRTTLDEVLAIREVVLRRDSREVTVAGAPVELTGKEFDLLACFLEHPGIVLSRERLLDLVWGMTYPGGTRTVDVHVAQLRRKLGDPEGIRTVRGAGYKLVPA